MAEMENQQRFLTQDRDLLGRLRQYFDSLPARVRDGQGWLIFNAGRERGARVSRFIAEQVASYRPFLSSYSVAWSDFALDAYIAKVELPASHNAIATESAHVQQEYQIAGQVSRDMHYHMLYADVFTVGNVAPAHLHELEHLGAVVLERSARRLPTLILTPRSPEEMTAWCRELDATGAAWRRIYERMYETSLIAL